MAASVVLPPPELPAEDEGPAAALDIGALDIGALLDIGADDDAAWLDAGAAELEAGTAALTAVLLLLEALVADELLEEPTAGVLLEPQAAAVRARTARPATAPTRRGALILRAVVGTRTSSSW